MEESIKSLSQFLRLQTLVFFALIAFSGDVFSKDSSSSERKTINLEAGIIKGRRLRPKIFLEFESTAPPISAVMFKRKDFVDFYKRDVKARLKYIPVRTR